MASQTLSNLNDLWAEGTSLPVFLQDAFGNPAGAAVDTKTVTGGAVTFAGLADATNYVAAQGGKTKRFRTPVAAAVAPSSSLGSTAAIHKLAGQTFDIANASVGGVALAQATRHWTKIPVDKPGIANSIIFETAVAGVDGAAVLANCFFGLHRGSDAELIGTTGDITGTLKTAAGIKQPPISSVGGLSLDISLETFLYVQFVIGTQSSTAVQLARASNSITRCNAGLTAPDFAYGSTPGVVSTLASNLSAAGVAVQVGAAWWLGVGVA